MAPTAFRRPCPGLARPRQPLRIVIPNGCRPVTPGMPAWSLPTWTISSPGSRPTAWHGRTRLRRGISPRSCTPGEPPARRRSPRTPTPISWPAAGGSRSAAAWRPGGDAGRPAALPRQRPAGHRHRPYVQRRPGGVARPGRPPRPGPVRTVLEDHKALPDRGQVRRPHRLPRAGPGAGRRRHQFPAAAHRGRIPPPATVREAFARHTGRHLLEGYGLTEATCASTFTPPGVQRPGSVGRPLPGQQVKAVRIGDDG